MQAWSVHSWAIVTAAALLSFTSRAWAASLTGHDGADAVSAKLAAGGKAASVYVEAPESASSGDSASSDAPTRDTQKPDERMRRELRAQAVNADPLESAVVGMRDAQSRIESADTGAQTRDIQHQVVEDLNRLIEFAKNMQRPPSEPISSQQQQQQDSGQQPDEQTVQDAPRQDSQSAAEQDRADTQGSQDRSRQADETEAELFSRQQLVDEVWGHLPGRLRHKLQNIYNDKALPRYEELVRRYFEALAEQSGRNGAR